MNLKKILFPLSDWKMCFHSRERGWLRKPGHDLGRIAADVIHVQQCYTMLYNVKYTFKKIQSDVIHVQQLQQMLYMFNKIQSSSVAWDDWNRNINIMLQCCYSYSCSQLWFIFSDFKVEYVPSELGFFFFCILCSLFCIMCLIFWILCSLFCTLAAQSLPVLGRFQCVWLICTPASLERPSN